MGKIEKYMDKVEKKGEKKGMELWAKILLTVAGIAGAGLIVFGVNSYNAAKDNAVQQAASVVEVNNTQTDFEQLVDETIEQMEVDNTLEYEKEAKELWGQHSEELICTEDVFVDKYVGYRNNGLSKEEAWNSLYNEFAKVNQAEFNEDGEVIANDEALEAIMNSEDEDISEEVVETTDDEIVGDYVVEDIEACQLYAISAVNIRKGPDASDFDKVGSLKLNQRVTVTGIVKEYKGEPVLWYRLEGSKGNTGFVSGAYLAETQVVVETETGGNSGGGTGGNTGDTGNTGGFVVPGGFGGGFSGAGGGQADADHGGNPNINLQ